MSTRVVVGEAVVGAGPYIVVRLADAGGKESGDARKGGVRVAWGPVEWGRGVEAGVRAPDGEWAPAWAAGRWCGSWCLAQFGGPSPLCPATVAASWTAWAKWQAIW